jgi:hypothetical protein
MRRVDFLASELHYADHLLPVWHALPTDTRKTFYGTRPVVKSLEAQGLRAVLLSGGGDQNTDSGNGNVAVVASGTDLTRALRMVRVPVMMEHGAGQSYLGTEATSYLRSAAPIKNSVGLELVPGPDAAAVYRAVHPNIPCAVIGCPKLDRLHLMPPKPRAKRPVVCISFHFECVVVPETRSAFEHYRKVLPALLQAKGYQVVAHCHPRAKDTIGAALQKMGFEFIPDFAEVMEIADVYCMDHMSTLYEFASLGRPVVVLNAPWYRRNVNHGLRYWDAADVGVQCDEPSDLDAAIRKALVDAPEQQGNRQRALGRVYGYMDGHCAERAADAIVGFADALDVPQEAGGPRSIVARTFTYRGKEFRKGDVIDHPAQAVHDAIRRYRWAAPLMSNAPALTPAPAPVRASTEVIVRITPAPVIAPEPVPAPVEDIAAEVAAEPTEDTASCAVCGKTFTGERCKRQLQAHSLSHKKTTETEGGLDAQ